MTNQTLLQTPAPHADENYIDYILRLAESNGYGSPSWIFSLAGLHEILSCEKAMRNDKLTVAIGKLARIQPSELRKLHAQAVLTKGKKSVEYVIHGRKFPPGMVRFGHTKICPACLRKNSYIRSIWSVAFVTACPIHQTVMIDRCPACGKRIKWNRNKVNECKCTYDLRTIKTSKASDVEVMLSSKIYAECNLSSRSHRRVDNILDTLQIEHAMSVMMLFAKQYARMKKMTEIRFFSLDFSKQREIFISAAHVFDKWPLGFYAFLDEVRVFSRNKYKKKRYGLMRDFGNFYVRLYQGHQDEYQFIRDSFRDYVQNNWTHGYFSSKYMPELEDEVYITREKAAKQLHINAAKVLRLVKSGKLKGAILKIGKTEMCLVDKNDLLNQQAYCENVVTLEKAVKHLGLSRDSVIDLVLKGVIRRSDNERNDERMTWNIQFFDIVMLMMRISKIINENNMGTLGEAWDFNRTIRSLAYIEDSAGSLLLAVLSGEIRPCGWKRKNGLKGLLFRKKEIDRYRAIRYAAIYGNYISIEQAAKLLGMNDPKPLYCLIKKQKISIVQLSEGKRRIRRISMKVLEEYKKKYITAGEISAKIKTTSSVAAGLAINCGVLPVSGSHVDGGRQYIFLRKLIDRVNITDHVNKLRDSRQMIQDENVVYLSSRQIKKALRLTQGEFLKYCQLRYLQSIWPTSKIFKPGCTRYYPRSEVAALRARLNEHAKLLSCSEAAKILKETCSSFYHNWVLSGRVKRVRFHENIIENCRVNRADVEEAKRLKMSTIRGVKAAEMLNVSLGAVGSWRRTGKLIPVSGPSIDGHGYFLYLKSDVERIREERVNRVAKSLR